MIEIIKYVVVIFLLDQFLLIVFKKANRKWQKYVTFGILVIMYAGFYQIFIDRLPQNFYQTFSAQRIFSPEGLKTIYKELKDPDTSMLNGIETSEATLPEEITFQYETLLNEMTRLVYDKFGPEIIQLTRIEGKEIDPLALFGTYRIGFLVRDGVFYFIFGLIIIAVSTEEKLRSCRKACYAIITCFYALEMNFLWPDNQSYDIFDYIFPKYALWQRINILKGFIGILCITVKVGFRRRNCSSGQKIEESFILIRKLQKNLSIKARAIDSGEILKNCPDHSDFKSHLMELSKLMEDTSRSYEEKSSEKKKKESHKQNKWRAKPSLIAIGVFIFTYYFANA